MEVCAICGALLVANDAEERAAAHLEGKQHTGYDRIRKEYQRLKVSEVVPMVA